jgi:hypothetical protein
LATLVIYPDQSLHFVDHPIPNATPTLLKSWPVFIAWLPMGRVFDADAAHFGPGFFPTLLWLLLVPVLAILSGIAVIVELVRLRKRLPKEWWRPLVWAATSALYWLTYTGWIPLAP